MNKIKAFVIAHKILSGVIAVAVLGGGYVTYKHVSSGSVAPKYILAKAEKGALISSISGSGQVAAQEQVDVTSSVSGDITSILVKAGDQVKQGQVIARIDNADAIKTVQNAELALENSQVSYQKSVKMANDQAADSANSDLKKAYQTGYNAIANSFIDLPTIFSSVSDIYYTPSHSPYFTDAQIRQRADDVAYTYKEQAGVIFDSVYRDFQANFNAYKTITADSNPDDIVALLNTSNALLKKLLSALSGTYSTIDYISDKYVSNIPSEIASDKSALNGFVSKVNSDTTSVTNALTAIEDAKDSAESANLSMKSAELNQSQSETTLTNAKTDLADHDIKAPFDGIIAKVSAKLSDKASNNTNIATLITAGKLVNISLNEIDAAKVKQGDKASLTFDAIDDLTLAGHVSNVDLVGTVSQGVVSYNVEITFDDNDDRVKPGMTVSADIVTSAKTDVLTVPSSAVKTQGSNTYVQMLDAAGVPQNKSVVVGISNDTSTEIISGLSEGDEVVTRTVTATTAATAAPSILQSIGGNRTGAAAGATRTFSR